MNNDTMTISLDDLTIDDTITLTGAGYNNIGTNSIPPLTTSQISALNWGTATGAYIATGVTPGLYTTTNTATTWGTLTINDDIKGSSLNVKGDAEFSGDVKIQGKSISEMFDRIEERLAILHPNPTLEDKWDELKELGKRYRELEKDIIEKEKIWKILKK